MAETVEPSSMVRLREPNALFSRATRWKVTARYTVQTGLRTSIKCVRVRSCCQPSVVLHFSEKEFLRLYEPES